MNNIVIYHNPRCSKSRQTLALLTERDIEPEIVLYLDNTPSQEELAEVIKKLGIGPRELLRKGELAYKELKLDDSSLTDSQLIDAMTKEPKLIERPIVINGEKAAIGRPPEAILDII